MTIPTHCKYCLAPRANSARDEYECGRGAYGGCTTTACRYATTLRHRIEELETEREELYDECRTNALDQYRSHAP